jgi:small conductance mechanosensitive channel
MGDVKKITLIYTTLVTLNQEALNIPNRKVLNAEIVNYGSNSPIRIAVACTVNYEVNLNQFKQRLLKVPEGIDNVAKSLKPFVRVTNLGNFAAEFTLYVFTFSPKEIPQLKADLKEAIWRMYKTAGLSLTTPNLVQSVPVSTVEDEAVSRELGTEQRTQLPLPVAAATT